MEITSKLIPDQEGLKTGIKTKQQTILDIKLQCLQIASSFAGGINAVKDNYKELLLLLNLSE